MIRRRCSERHSNSVSDPLNKNLIRPIEERDNAQVAMILRSVMKEFGLTTCGQPLGDEELDAMYQAYPAPRAAFFVIESDGKVLGCGGMGPLAGADQDVCELRKMYFLPALRGSGVGTRLINIILDSARQAGYSQCYLETMSGMKAARGLYRKHGFEEVERPLGDTGHGGCNRWMLRSLV